MVRYFGSSPSSGGGGNPHPLLDGVQNNDTNAYAVTRGSLISGQNFAGTPLWNGLVLGIAGAILQASATDVTWSPFSVPFSVATGDIWFGFAANDLNALAIGTAGQSLIVSSGVPAWADRPISFVCTGSGLAIAINTTRYQPIAGSNAANNATETLTQVRCPRAGTLRRLRVRVSANTTTGNSTIGVNDNTVATGIIVTVGSGATGTFTDDVDTFAAAQNDLLDYVVIAATTGTSITIVCEQVDLF